MILRGETGLHEQGLSDVGLLRHLEQFTRQRGDVEAMLTLMVGGGFALTYC
jgi:hypothetical protein